MQLERQSHVELEQKGTGSLDFDFQYIYIIQTVKAWPIDPFGDFLQLISNILSLSKLYAHRRTGRGGQGGQLPPPQRLQSRKVRANVQHKSGEEWEIKKPKSPQFVGQTKAVGQYSFHSRAILAYYIKNWDKLCQFCGSFIDVWKRNLMFRKIL
jgi:hypothetical protein